MGAFDGIDAFVSGFFWAQERSADGLTWETLLAEAMATRPLDYQCGVEAWADLHKGWTWTALAQRATALGLEVQP